MTFEEAKKILEKEGFHLVLAPKVINQNGAIREFEKPEVCEAIKVANANRWTVGLSPIEWDEREARLKKEYEENHIKCGDPIPGSPALKEAASQFNDALLNEQAKEIERLKNENEDWKSWHEMQNRQIALSNIAFRNEKNRLGKEIARLNKVIHKKNEDLRLTKIREKNLAKLGLKYVGENEELKKELADKVVDKINAQALKSAESALAYKEKVIAGKDEVIDNLRKELKAQKGLVNHISKKYDGAKINLNLRMKECEKLKEALDEANKHQQQAYRSCADKNKEIRALKLQISALAKRVNGIDWKRNADAIKLYVNRASHERLWNPISQDICNEKELSFIINHGGKRVKYALHFDGTDIVYECSDPDKKSRIPTPEISWEELMKIQEKVVASYDIAEEGGDHSGVTVLCGKDFIDAIIKKMK